MEGEHKIVFLQIGKNIAKYRKQLGLTQAQLGALSCLSPSYIQKIETGKTKLSLGALFTLAHALKIPAYQIVGDDKKTAN